MKEDFEPCPVCHQYSHSISHDVLATAFNHFQAMIEAIKPAIAGIVKGDVKAASLANVRSVVRQLSESKPSLQVAIQKKELKIVGAQYHLDTGRVDILP